MSTQFDPCRRLNAIAVHMVINKDQKLIKDPKYVALSRAKLNEFRFRIIFHIGTCSCTVEPIKKSTKQSDLLVK